MCGGLWTPVPSPRPVLVPSSGTTVSMDIANGGRSRRCTPPVQFTSVPPRAVAGPQRLGRAVVDVSALLGLVQPAMSPALNEIILVVLDTLPVERQLLARQGRAEKIGFFRTAVGGIPAWLGAEEARGFPLIPGGIPFRYPLSIACWVAGGYPAQFPFQMDREVHRWAHDPVEVFHEDAEPATPAAEPAATLPAEG